MNTDTNTNNNDNSDYTIEINRVIRINSGKHVGRV
jgi:hypothetical protein